VEQLPDDLIQEEVALSAAEVQSPQYLDSTQAVVSVPTRADARVGKVWARKDLEQGPAPGFVAPLAQGLAVGHRVRKSRIKSAFTGSRGREMTANEPQVLTGTKQAGDTQE